MRVPTTFLAFVICNLLTMCLWAKVNDEANSADRLDLPGKHINVQVNHNLTLAVQKPGTGLIWRSSNTHIPDMVVRAGDAESRTLALASASNFSHAPFKDEKYLGYTVYNWKEIDASAIRGVGCISSLPSPRKLRLPTGLS